MLRLLWMGALQLVLLGIGAWGAVKLISGWVSLRRTLRVLSSLPHPPSTDTLLGSLELTKDKDRMYREFTRLSDELGGIYYFRVLCWPVVVVSDPALGQALLSARMDLPKAPVLYRVFDALTSPDGRQPNLLGHTTTGGYWRLVRKGVMPAFAPSNIKREFAHMLDLADQLCAILAAAGPAALVDIDNLLQRESMDVIGRVGFATDLGALRELAPSRGDAPAGGGQQVLDTTRIFPLVKALAHEVARRWAEPLRFRLRHVSPSGRRAEADLQELQACMLQLLRRVQARGPPAPGDTSISAHLLRIRDAAGQPLSDEQLAGEIGLFFLAGFETTGHTMAWAIFLLASHPEAAAKVEAELDEAALLVTPARPSPRRLEYSDLSKLKELNMCIKESMRLVPVVSGGTARMPTRDVAVGGHTLPAGVTIVVGGHGLHNSIHNWERPEEFLPARWAEPGAEYGRGDLCPLGHTSAGEARGRRGGPAAPAAAPGAGGAEHAGAAEEGDWMLVDSDRPPLRWAPFQQGPRRCAGESLASLNIAATLAVLLSRFRFELPEHLRGPGALDAVQHNLMTMQPRGGLPVRAIPRG